MTPELKRKWLHLAMGSFALLLRWLDWKQAALLALVALLHNLFLLPRYGGRALFRGAARERGHDPGIVLYPLSVLILTLLFWGSLPLVAAAWGLLAVGDGLATIVGVTLKGPRLPWNSDKSWSGFAAFALFGSLGAILLWSWVSQSTPTAGTLGKLAIAALVTALLESLPLGLNDNLTVPLGGGALIWLLLGSSLTLLASRQELFQSRLVWALAINLALAGVALAMKSVDRSGALHGIALGVALWVFGGAAAFAMLATFFFVGSAATKLGYATKLREGTAQEKGGRRGAKHAWANAGAGALIAYWGAATPGSAPLMAPLGIAASFATALSDTLGSEVGQAFGRRTFLITSFRPVPRGTDGAVSLEGTAAGVLGSLLIGSLAAAAGLCHRNSVWIIAVAAFIGTTLESYLGAWFERAEQIDNEAQNFLNTLAGGLIAIGLGVLIAGA